MPYRSKKQAAFMRLSSTIKGRKILKKSGKKPAPMKLAKKFVKHAKR